MLDRVFDWLCRNLRLVGIMAIALCVATWGVDLAGWTHKCPYCQVQRTAIGLAGVLMLWPDPRVWWVRYLVTAICLMGIHVAAAQLFLVYRNVTGGQPSNPVNLVMAAGALGFLTGQMLLLFTPRPPGQNPDADN